MSQKGKYLSVPPTTFGGIASIPQTNPNFGKTSKTMDPLSIISSVGGSVSSIANLFGVNSSLRKQIQAQRQENALNRQYNLMLARLQNKWNIDQWQRENDYNSPTAQMARYRAAGLNPNLIYGQQNTAASSPTLTAGASSAPQDMSAIGQKRNFGQAMQEMLNVEMQKAQIEAIKAGTENTKANTEKTSEETKNVVVAREGMSIQNYISSITAGDTIELARVNLKIATADLDMKPYEKQTLAENIKILQQTYEQGGLNLEHTRQQIELAKKQNAAAVLDMYFKWCENQRQDKKVEAEIKKLSAETNLSERQLYELRETWTARQAGIIAQNEIIQNNKVVSEYDAAAARRRDRVESVPYDIIDTFGEQYSNNPNLGNFLKYKGAQIIFEGLPSFINTFATPLKGIIGSVK